MAAVLSNTLPLPDDAPPPEKPAQVQFQIVLLLIAVGLGSLLQLAGPAWSRGVFEHVQLGSLEGLWNLLLALGASILAHELGHLFAALYLNYALLGMAIGPLQLSFWHKKTVLQVRAGQWARCSVSAVPRDLQDCWRSRMLAVVAAGPAVSFFLLIVSAVLAMSSVEPVGFWSSCAEVNFFLVTLGLIPNHRLAAVRNDAALFLALWKNDTDALDMFRCHQAIELAFRGIRPDQFPEELLLELARFPGRPYTRLMVAQRMVEWAIDSGNLALASEWDRAALATSERCQRHLANRALAESACFDVLFRADFAAAKAKFAQVDFEPLFPPPMAERARAANWLAVELPEKAARHILRAQYQLPLGDGYYNFERLLLHELRMKALTQTAGPSRC